GVVAAGEHVVEGVYQLFVGEGARIGGGELRQQALQVALVVQQHRLPGGVGGGELAPLGGVGDGDVQGQLARSVRRAVQGHAPLDEGAEHGEEAPAGGLDGGGVGAVRGDVAVAVEQVGAGH